MARLVAIAAMSIQMFLSGDAIGFPELISHGYTSCVSCHVSPSGGGVVTPYGRALSDEAISAWSAGERNSQFVHGLVETPAWLIMGGDIRAAQIHVDNPSIRYGAIFLMQLDLEAAARLNDWTVAVSYGLEKRDKKALAGGISRSHYLAYQLTESFSLRGGRFFPAFGIRTPDHVIFTRKDIGWDQGQESYNFEAVYLDEHYELFVDGIFGRPDQDPDGREKGFSIRGSRNFWERYSVGLSLYRGERRDRIREIAGLFTLLGFSKKMSLLAEFDLQKVAPHSGRDVWGRVMYTKASYSLIKGVNATLTGQQSFLDFRRSELMKNYYGFGFQIFPSSHFEIQIEWQRRKDDLIAVNGFYDFAWLQLHYYL